MSQITPTTAVGAAFTVIPAIFKDPERALANLVDAKQRLDQANDEVRVCERATAEKIAKNNPVNAPKLAEDGRSMLAPLVVDAERARSSFDVAFAIYQETARARDAAAANKLAESNNAGAAANVNATKRIKTLTFVLAVAAALQAIATVVQLWHTWRH